MHQGVLQGSDRARFSLPQSSGESLSLREGVTLKGLLISVVKEPRQHSLL